jgi:hypothetical protein
MALTEKETPKGKRFKKFMRYFRFIYPLGWVTTDALAEIFLETIKK